MVRPLNSIVRPLRVRPTVLQAWNDAISQAVAEKLPQFALYPKRERGEDRGMLRFVWRPTPDLSCFVVFRPISSEAFDAYVGWSTDGRCPFALPQDPDSVSTFHGVRAMRPSMDFVPRHGEAHWSFWDSSDELLDDPAEFARQYAAHFARDLSYQEARALVSPAIDAGIEEVVRFGVPYLSNRAGEA